MTLTDGETTFQRRGGTHLGSRSKPGGRPRRISCISAMSFFSPPGLEEGADPCLFSFPHKATGKGVYGLAADQDHKGFNGSQSDLVKWRCRCCFSLLNGVNNHIFYNFKTLGTSVPGTLYTDPQIRAMKHRPTLLATWLQG